MLPAKLAVTVDVGGGDWLEKTMTWLPSLIG